MKARGRTMSDEGTRIVLSAGEASGDLLAALAIPALKARLPQAELAGIAGDRMMAAGCEPWWHVRELSVRGYAEVLRHLPRLLRMRADLVTRTVRWPASVFVGVDAPDFNLGVAARVKAAGIATVHYVSPAVWAWRPERLRRIGAAVDAMLLVFPFEEAIYRQAGLPARYVGHPLATTIPRHADARQPRIDLGLAASAPTVAVLPGSRLAEVRSLGAAFCAALAELQRADTRLQGVVPAADDGLHAELKAMLQAAGTDPARTHLTRGQSHAALAAADVVLVAGGTATLEALLFKRPMVIAYRVPAFTEWLTLRKAIVPYFGLPNILCGRYTVPEFLQEAVTGPALARALLHYLEQPAETARLVEQFDAIHASMQRDTPSLVAEAIADAVRRQPCS